MSSLRPKAGPTARPSHIRVARTVLHSRPEPSKWAEGTGRNYHAPRPSHFGADLGASADPVRVSHRHCTEARGRSENVQPGQPGRYVDHGRSYGLRHRT